jgi:hypothetical protein
MALARLKQLGEPLARIWVIVALAMAASGFGGWPVAALTKSQVPLVLAGVILWLAPTLGLAWSAVLIYRVLNAESGAT